MQPQWAYDPQRKVIFDLSRRDDLGLPAIVAVSVEPEDGRLIEVAPRMLGVLRSVVMNSDPEPGESPDWCSCAACRSREILTHIDGAKKRPSNSKTSRSAIGSSGPTSVSLARQTSEPPS